MKIAVIGGTGLIGSKLVNKLREHGHEAVAAAPNTGVNTLTGEGLAEVLKGASVVVDVSNSPAWEDAAVLTFLDRKSTRLNSSHSQISYAVFCLKKKNTIQSPPLRSIGPALATIDPQSLHDY